MYASFYQSKICDYMRNMFLVSPQDQGSVNRWDWYENNCGYFIRKFSGKTTTMHRFLIGNVPDGF